MLLLDSVIKWDMFVSLTTLLLDKEIKVRVIKNVQSRETGNIGYTRHKMKTDKTKNTLDTIIRKHTQIT